MISIEDLEDLSVNAAKKLFEIDSSSVQEEIVFPYYYKRSKIGKKRISEQELRLAFCKTLFEENKQKSKDNNSKYYFSVENPTELRYANFSDNKSPAEVFSKNSEGRSASIDLCIYNKKPIIEDLHPKDRINIEFKAHNVKIKNIAKDLLKLIAEKGHGVFFHLLKSINNGTLTVNCGGDKKGTQQGILTKYNDFGKYVTTNINLENRSNKNSILFVLCSLEPKLIISRCLKKSELLNGEIDFCIDYKVKNKQIDIIDLNGWERH